ncbi:MAG TPA: SAM-dependent methyltransferase [Blastocatellia bacterium]|nr:SAM-dependent methyltransferase [Blastocatellia bacterium]
MPFDLDRVVPWGRCLDEYARMFALADAEMAGRILGCGDGPASFNCEATERGHRVVSCDPVYECSAEEIERRVRETSEVILSETRRNRDDFVWTYFRSVEELGEVRLRAMRRFVEDFPRGKRAGRYVEASLPALPFADREFDLALSSHFLFLYSGQLSLDFHVASILEMCRVAGEARVFPLLQIGGARSPHLDGVVEALGGRGMKVEFVNVPYEFQRGGNQMLRVVAPAE